MSILTPNIKINTIKFTHSIYYQNIKNTWFHTTISDEIKVHNLSIYDLDNEKEIKSVYEIEECKVKHSNTVNPKQFIKFIEKYEIDKFITNYCNGELYTEFVNYDGNSVIMHPEIGSVRVSKTSQENSISLKIHTNISLLQDQIERINTNVKLSNVSDKKMLKHFYQLYGLNRDDKNDHEKIIKLLEKEMGILHSTEPNTIEDLEELALTKLWVGLK